VNQFTKALIIHLSLCIVGVLGMVYVWAIVIDTTSEQTPVTFAELQALDDLDQRVELTAFRPVGEMLAVQSRRKTIECQPIVSISLNENQEADSSSWIFLVNRNANQGHSLASSLESGSIKGFARFNDPSKDQFGETLRDEITQQYPLVDLDSATVVSITTPFPLWCWVVLGFFTIWSIAAIPYCFWSIKKAQREDEAWRARIPEDRAAAYQKHKRAMRLVDYSSGPHGNPHAKRQTDSTFDVPQPKRTNSIPRTKKALWKIGVISAFALIGGLLQYAASFSELGGVAGDITHYLTIGFVFLGAHVAGPLVAEKTTSKQEEPIDREKAKYRTLGFHAYHHSVLSELGFEDVGDYQLVGHAANLRRTIYFSQNQNLVVEVGTEMGRQFFTLETLLNNGKFVETHSLLPSGKETLDLTGNFIRRSATHQDIVLALEEHDQLINELNYGGTVMEAEFSKEKLERFLRWPSSNESKPN